MLQLLGDYWRKTFMAGIERLTYIWHVAQQDRNTADFQNQLAVYAKAALLARPSTQRQLPAPPPGETNTQERFLIGNAKFADFLFNRCERSGHICQLTSGSRGGATPPEKVTSKV